MHHDKSTMQWPVFAPRWQETSKRCCWWLENTVQVILVGCWVSVIRHLGGRWINSEHVSVYTCDIYATTCYSCWMLRIISVIYSHVHIHTQTHTYQLLYNEMWLLLWNNLIILSWNQLITCNHCMNHYKCIYIIFQ